MHVYTSRIGRSLLRISKLRLVFEISSFNIDSVGFLDLQLTLFQNYSFVLLVSPPVHEKDLGMSLWTRGNKETMNGGTFAVEPKGLIAGQLDHPN